MIKILLMHQKLDEIEVGWDNMSHAQLESILEESGY